MRKENRVIESILWSIALPGFAQILNGQLLKGIPFVLFEVLININANFNEVIRLSFTGQIEEAIANTNYQWLMFYPCLYFFAMWDAFKDAGGGKEPFSYLPFVFSAYLVTLGIIYSPYVKIFGVVLGIVWFPMLCTLPGLAVGLLLKRILLMSMKKD
ncbi:hypothetical protein LC048_11100 [Mesobacillus subterraneus]|uniref:hypothetical protein n=1 Tax=Mesobacillus subterraneus TaxID=285983 RepID=UPI001CFED01A|nr:hypothetical protein [Mesobacillus subterraneus]WLR57348.1 hypothetical protein LC048_11100 [Mesobacillus subterraneus]